MGAPDSASAAARQDSDTIILWPSGATAVCVAGQVVAAYSDAPKAKILASFNHLGEGSVSYSNGKPWLVVTREGWSVSDAKGNIVERGKHPRTGAEVRCEPIPELSVSFVDRQRITLTFESEGAQHQWECGERLRRTESHLDKVVGVGAGGKLQLDVTAIRARQAAVGSVYVAKGPHAYVTEHRGIGSLKTSLKTALRPGGDVQRAVQQLQAQDARLQLIETLPVPTYGTSRRGRTDALAASQHSGGGALLPTLSAGGAAADAGALGQDSARGGSATARAVSSPNLPDFGSPPMSSKQRRWQRVGEGQGRPAPYQPGRARLPNMSVADVRLRAMGKDALRDTLYCLCVLGDFNPSCGRLLPRLEAGWADIQAKAAADPAGGFSHIQVFRVDATESDFLQRKFAFRVVPMFLCFFEGSLVHADNNISTKEELVAACASALERGRKREFLPGTFRFRAGADNSLLNHITPLMTLRA